MAYIVNIVSSGLSFVPVSSRGGGLRQVAAEVQSAFDRCAFGAGSGEVDLRVGGKGEGKGKGGHNNKNKKKGGGRGQS